MPTKSEGKKGRSDGTQAWEQSLVTSLLSLNDEPSQVLLLCQVSRPSKPKITPRVLAPRYPERLPAIPPCL